MNKLFPTKQITSAWLAEITPERTISGIKNIIGIKLKYNEKEIFYSIFDECFFKIMPPSQNESDFFEKNANKVFVSPHFENNLGLNPLGMNLFEKLKKDFITKEELLANKKNLMGYYSDLDYEQSIDNRINYEEESTIKENIITSVDEYSEKLSKTITLNPNQLYGPSKKKVLNNN